MFSHNIATVIAIWWQSFHSFKSYGSKHSFLIKTAHKIGVKKKTKLKFQLNQKQVLYIFQRIYEGKICTEWIFHIFKIQCIFFFFFFLDTKGNCVFNSIFCILENFDTFDTQKIIKGLDINPNFKKIKKNLKNDYRLDFHKNFDSYFCCLFFHILS